MDALLQAKTIAEVSLALSAFSEYAAIFGVVADDPSDSLIIGTSSSKKMLYCSSLHARKAGSPAKKKGSGRRAKGDDEETDRPRRSTAAKISYKETD